MTDFKTIKGFNIRYLAEDPVQLGIPGATWATGGNLNTGRGFMSTNGIGTQTAAAVVAGFASVGPNTYYANTELYNGSAWTESGDLPSGRYRGMGGGTQTAGIYAGGYDGAWPAESDTFYFNGTTWSNQSAPLNTARDGLAGTGLQTAAIASGGVSGPGAPADNEVESWNGTAWTEIAEMNQARYEHAMAGTQTDAIMGPGLIPSAYQAVVETWNGTAWTEVSEINTSRTSYGMTNEQSGGATTGALLFAGRSQPTGSPDLAQTEYWNGSSWAELNDLAISRSRISGLGTTTAALAAGAWPDTNNTATEEFTTAGPTANGLIEGDVWYNYSSFALKGYGKAAGIPAATWSSGGSLNVARRNAAGIGTQTANLFIGGENPSTRPTATESYDGTSWTEVNDIATARGSESSFGIQTAGVIAGGELNPGATTNVTELWNGTSWTTSPATLNTARRGLTNSGAGTQTAGLTIGGAVPASTAVTESWDGTSFTEESDLNTARQALAAHGTQTDALAAAGYTTVGVNNVETWDGTSWTETTEVNTSRLKLGGAGISTSFLAYGGQTPTPSVVGNTEYWNGSTWTELNDMATSRSVGGDSGSGSSISALASGGSTDAAPPGTTTATEEWTADAAVSSFNNT